MVCPPPPASADRLPAGRVRCVAAVVALSLALLVSHSGCQRGSSPVPRRVVDLTPPLTPEMAMQRLGGRVLEFLGTDGRVGSTPLLPKEAQMAFGLQSIHVLSHIGAHLDASSRLLRGGEGPGQIPVDRIVGKARVVDLRWHNRHAPIQITDLELTPIESDEIVLLLLGYEPPNTEEWPLYAPLSVQAAEYLVAKGIRALGTDLPTLARFDEIESRLRKRQPPEAVWAEYLPFFQNRIPVIAGLMNIDAVARERNIVFAGLPLALPQATGAPVRAVAIVY